MSMDPKVERAISEVRRAWPVLRQRLDIEGVLSSTIPDNCILATATAIAVLQHEYDLDVASMACDLYARASDDEYEAIVEHPEGSTAIKGDGYVGHVVAVINDGSTPYLFDLELDVLAPLGASGYTWAESSTGAAYQFVSKPSRTEYQACAAWERYRQVAPRLVEEIRG